MQKLYCYVDETGLDTEGAYFLVSVIVTGEERDQLNTTLEQIEQKSGKGKVKWAWAKDSLRLAYIKTVLNENLLSGKLCYATYHNTKDYMPKVVLTTARAFSLHVVEEEYKATVLIDGLPKPLIPEVGTALRQLHVRTAKVRGVKDENEPLIRLADAICGFVRAAEEGRRELKTLLDLAKKRQFIREL
jgi:hypothetical protein